MHTSYRHLHFPESCPFLATECRNPPSLFPHDIRSQRARARNKVAPQCYADHGMRRSPCARTSLENRALAFVVGPQPLAPLPPVHEPPVLPERPRLGSQRRLVIDPAEVVAP